MARSAKTRTDKPATPSDAPDVMAVEDAEIIDATDLTENVPDQSGLTKADDTLASTETAAPPVDSVLIVEEVRTPEPEPEQIAEAPPEPESALSRQPWRDAAEPPAEPPAMAATPAPQQITVKKVGFVPVVLGGVVAAGLGFAAAWQGLPYLNGTASDTGQTEAFDAQAARIAALESQIAVLPAATDAPDMGPLTADIAALRSEVNSTVAPLAETISALDARVVALDDRLAALERAPAPDGTLPDTAIAAWEAEIEALRAEIAAQNARMQTIADEAAARLDAAQTTVAEIEQSAAQSAAAMLQRAAVTRMQAAVDSGDPFEAAIADLTETGIAVPADLVAVSVDGVPTLSELSEAFPEAAREALATARAEGLADDGDGRFMSFLRNQLDVRSVTPREGEDPDAILSRAEAALRDGRLSDALAEVAALPEVVRQAFSGWIASAESRVSAIAALQTLSESLPESSN